MSPMESRPQAIVLNNDYILTEILSHLAFSIELFQASTYTLDTNIQVSRQHLYNAALVSRSFASPALNFLWQTMSSIKPLIDLIPVVHYDRWLKVHSLTYETHNMEQGVDIFTRYAKKVQIFCYSPQEEPDIDLDWMFFHALKGHPMIPSPLLPNLRMLYVSSLCASNNHAVLFNILSPSLRFVKVSSWATTSSHLIRTFLTCLLTQAHDLQHFRLDDPNGLTKEVQDQLFSFQQLRAMHITFPNRKIFWPLSALDELPNLTTLSMDFSLHHIMPFDRIRIPCQSLEVLSITCPISPMFELLAALEAPNLCEVHLNFLHDTNDVRLDQDQGDASVIGALAKWSSSLRILHVDITQWDLLAVLRARRWPLVQFERLQFVEVRADDNDIAYDLYEKGCWELARSLPNVKNLSLPVSCLISFKSLLAIVFLCPHLRFLQVGIDTASSLDVLGAEAISFANKLQTLSVGDTTVADYFILAHRLILSFPNLSNIISSSHTWGSVNDLLRFAHSLNVVKPHDKIISTEHSQIMRNRLVRDLADCRLPDELRLQ